MEAIDVDMEGTDFPISETVGLEPKLVPVSVMVRRNDAKYKADGEQPEIVGFWRNSTKVDEEFKPPAD